MIQELAEYIVGNLMISDNWTVAKREAEKVLRLIELNGMLPPADYHPRDKEANETVKRAELYMKWEFEDEKK